MAKKKKEKKEEKASFDYIEYIKDKIDDSAFLYYILSNKIILKNKEEVENLYKKIKKQ